MRRAGRPQGQVRGCASISFLRLHVRCRCAVAGLKKEAEPQRALAATLSSSSLQVVRVLRCDAAVQGAGRRRPCGERRPGGARGCAAASQTACVAVSTHRRWRPAVGDHRVAGVTMCVCWRVHTFVVHMLSSAPTADYAFTIADDCTCRRLTRLLRGRSCGSRTTTRQRHDASQAAVLCGYSIRRERYDVCLS